MKEFLLKKIKPQTGAVVLSDGRKIGEHDGLPFYTIGQRHLKMQNVECRMQNNESETKPLYVVGKKFDTNELIVGDEDDPLLYKKEIEVGEVNWIRQTPKFPLKCEVRLRHRQTLQKCRITNQESRITVEFDESQRAVTPGQFAVFYKDGECLGGGVIL